MEYQDQTTSAFRPRGTTKYVRMIIIACCVGFVLQLFADQLLTNVFALSLTGMSKLYIWQPLTYIFLHGGPWHLLVNMLIFYFVGGEVEYVLGSRRFIKLFLASGIIAGIGWLTISFFTKTYGPCIGASGAVYGILCCFAGMFPDKTISLLIFFILPITMRARTMALGIIAVSALMMTSNAGGVAHSAHLFGAVTGYLYGLRIHKNPGLLDSHLYSQPSSNPVISWFSNIRAKIRRSQFKVVPHDEPPPTQQEIDRVLDKINAQGMKSLTIRERQILRRASDKQ
jgi:membrane associated rhomboid family serine protease